MWWRARVMCVHSERHCFSGKNVGEWKENSSWKLTWIQSLLESAILRIESPRAISCKMFIYLIIDEARISLAFLFKYFCMVNCGKNFNKAEIRGRELRERKEKHFPQRKIRPFSEVMHNLCYTMLLKNGLGLSLRPRASLSLAAALMLSALVFLMWIVSCEMQEAPRARNKEERLWSPKKAVFMQ